MRFIVAHHPGAYLCRYFNAKDFFRQTERETYKAVITLKLRYNEAVDPIKWAGYTAQELNASTFAYFYLTALNADTTQLILDRLPEVFRSKNPLQLLPRHSFL